MALVLLAACERRAAAPAGALARYHLSSGADSRATLPPELSEVSGLAVGPGGRLFAQGDEEGRIFEVEPATGRTVKSFALQPGTRPLNLGKKPKDGLVTGDFEDLAIVGDRFYLTTSTGVLIEFGEGQDGQEVPFTAHPTPLGKTCEIEGLAHDPASQSLLLLCKEMRDRARRDRIEIHAWSLRDRKLEPRARVVLPFSALAPLTGGRRFNGSALALIPGSTSLAIIAGPQRLFVEIGADGRPVAGGAFGSAELFQPEGMAFLADGTLLISSEGGKGQATIFGYRPR
jgi:uncharacterized protein YjiK